MNNTLIDCGTHFGEGLRELDRIYKFDHTWDIHTFEANPDTFNHFTTTQQEFISKYNIKVHNKAVYTKSGLIKFHQQTNPSWNEPKMGGGSSIMDLTVWNPHNATTNNQFNSIVEVDAIDLSEFILQLNVSNIVLKLDIEGAEFDVLEKIIECSCLKLIKTIYIEFHNDESKVFKEYVDHFTLRKNNIVEKIKVSGVDLKEQWW